MPDLSFSELTFLNASKAQPVNHAVPENRKSRKKDVDRDEELSRFFASTGAPTNRGRQGHTNEERRTRHDREQQEVPRYQELQSSVETSPAAAAGLPDRPFLGFGEPGPRPPSLLDPNEIPPSITSSTRKTADASASHSTSYFTWSRSSATDRGFINRIPHHSTVVSPLKDKAHPRSNDKSTSTSSKVTPQQSRGGVNVDTTRRHRVRKSNNLRYQMYGALHDKPDESIVNLPSPKIIPVSADERDELKSILARRSREFDLRISRTKDDRNRGSNSSNIPLRKSRGPPVVMEGTEALTAVLDNWFEKHERRFVRLATARTNSPDQDQDPKEVQEVSLGANTSQDTLGEGRKLVRTGPVQESGEHPKDSPSNLQPSPNPGAAQKSQDKLGNRFPHDSSPNSPPEPQAEKPVNDTQQDGGRLQDTRNSKKAFGTDHREMPLDANLSSEKMQSSKMTSVNPRMCPPYPTVPNRYNWRPQPSAFSTTEQWIQPRTLYGQHLAEDFDHGSPARNAENIAHTYSEAPDVHQAYSAFDPNLHYFRSEYIESCSNTADSDNRFPDSNTRAGGPAKWNGSAFAYDNEQHPQENALRTRFDVDQELYHGDYYECASSRYDDVQDPNLANERVYLDRQTDYPTPEHSHSPYKSPNCLSEKIAFIDGRDYDSAGPHFQEPPQPLRCADSPRILRKTPRSTGRLFRPREVPVASLDEMKVAIPSDFWRPALY